MSAKLSIEQLKKLAAVEIMAEVNDNFDILGVINKLVYRPNYKAPAATDDRVIIISDKLFNYPVPQIYFILNHEFDHIYYRHHNRFAGKGIKHYIVNIATDLIINEILVNEGLEMASGGVTRYGVQKELNTRITGRNSEDVYDQIIEAMKKKENEDKYKDKRDEEEQQKQEQNDDNQEDDNDQNGDDQNDNDQNGDQEQNSGEGNSEEQEIEKQLDRILGKGNGKQYKEEIDNQEDSIKQSDGEPLDEEEKQKIEAIKERIAAKRGSANRRDREELERGYKPPQIDWKSMLKRFLGRYLKRAEVRNYNRPTRRYDDVLQTSRVILPSMKGYVTTPKINVYLDISGSMSGIIENVREILKEAKRYFKQYSSKYYEFDMQIYELSKSEFFDKSGAYGGGTDIKRVLTHYNQDSKADLGILITDAEDNFIDMLNAIEKPTLLLTNNKTLTTKNPKVTLVTTNFE